MNSGLDLDGDFNSMHGQVGTILAPGVDQLSPQTHQLPREWCFAIIIQTWGANKCFLMIHTGVERTPGGTVWI